MHNNDKFQSLRRQYPLFEYVAYHHEETPEGLRLWFDFRMGDIEFHPTAVVERRPFLDFEATIDDIVFNIGMVELVSYWKCACPPAVKVLCGSLSDSQIAFWRKLYWHGLGEFFYTNGIDASFDDYMHLNGYKTAGEQHQILPTGVPSARPTTHYPLSTHYLVPIGGGKDSVVTLELLRRAGRSVRPLIMNPRGATVECAAEAGFAIDDVLVIRRTIDPVLLDLNKQGYLNGHTPFSAMLAFYTHLASVLSGIPNVALSNESSANEPTVLVRDQSGANENKWDSVNHQYSKSLEFEDDFRAYSPSFNYFSFLRPLTELQIAMLFSRFTAYHDVFRSCNVGSKQDIWCGHCAKCLFAYIILSPFIAPKRLNAIFGKSMLDDMSLRTEFLQLTGHAETKPFECVGTVSEVNAALSMAIERWYPVSRPALLKDFAAGPIPPADTLHTVAAIGNLIPDELQILQQACSEKTN